MSPNIKKLGQSIRSKKKGFMMAEDGGAQRQRMIPNLKMFTFSELTTATKNFGRETFLGEGGYGKVFIGRLEAEVKFLGTFSHPNVVKLFGHCWENKNFLLVYEYMQKGSLDMLLFKEDAEPLSWDTRVKIALRAAQGHIPVLFSICRAKMVLVFSHSL